MFGSLFKRKKDTPQPMPVLRTPVSSAPKKEAPKKAAKPDKRRYLCNSCGYRFSRMAHIDFNNICPYCGKRGVVDDMTADADKLIQASETFDDERFFGNR
jgi:hypothetical protein